MAGRKPKPTQLKILDGNPGMHPLPKNEPKPKLPLGGAPPWFDSRQRRVWDDVFAQAPKGLLKNVDRALVEVYVCAYLEHMDCTILIREEGMTIETMQGTQKSNPVVAARRAAAKDLLRACAEMGFTPSSRTKVSVDASDLDDDEEQTPFKRFRSA